VMGLVGCDAAAVRVACRRMEQQGHILVMGCSP
jgi:hypothetical protein